MIRKTALSIVSVVLVSMPLVGLADATTESKIDALVARMTLEEKIGQTALRGTSSRERGRVSEELLDRVRGGEVGAFLNVTSIENVDALQNAAVNESRLGIPLVFARDVIHGYRTIFPVPIGMASSWSPDLVETATRVSAEEATLAGIRWTFAPMIDISRDARWGRIAESLGEDPYLSSALARAMVRGFQGDDLARQNSMAATAKHFAAYGAAEGGRDYNTVSMSEQDLREIYLPPFKAAAEEGAASFMTSFNEVNGVPATGNRFLLQQVLRDEWGYDGMVVSDWDSTIEMIAHGFARDEKEAAFLSARAGLDMEMTSQSYERHLAELVREERISEAQLDEFVRNVLRMKFRLGLFENPHRRPADDETILSPAHLAMATDAAMQSMVLLRNENHVLPLDESRQTIALIGPMADAPHDQLGTWVFDSHEDDSVTPLQSLTARLGDRLNYAPGLEISRTKSRDGFDEALRVAADSDVIVFVGGEESILSGEAHSRADIRLPGAQEALLLELAKLNKPIVLVVMAGRPIVLANVLDSVDAVLMAWHPGTMAGDALSGLLFGDESPSGRLPITWPKAVGQIPIYYNHKNTGRPPEPDEFVQLDDIPVGAWQSSLGNDSHYLDIGYLPEFPFGFGLTYSDFEYSDVSLSRSSISMDETLTASATVRNVGEVQATEVVQLYIHDLFGATTRPVRELQGFERITLAPGASATVEFTIRTEQLSFYDEELNEIVEPGDFHVWIAPDAARGAPARFTLLPVTITEHDGHSE